MIDPMAGKFRALIAALVVLIVAIVAGALFGLCATSNRFGAPRRERAASAMRAIAHDGDAMRTFHRPQLFDKALADSGDRVLQAVRSADAFRGRERSAHQVPCNSNHVAHPRLPDEVASGDPQADAQRMASVVAYAQHTYGKRLGADGSNGADRSRAERRHELGQRSVHRSISRRTRFKACNESLNGGDFGGIGVYILQLKDGEVVLQPIEGAPASLAGMKPGEVVDTVDGRAVHGVPIDLVER